MVFIICSGNSKVFIPAYYTLKCIAEIPRLEISSPPVYDGFGSVNAAAVLSVGVERREPGS